MFGVYVEDLPFPFVKIECKNRVLANDTINEILIETTITDKIETSLFRDGDWMVVEEYETEEKARLGHKRWIDICNHKGLKE